MNRDLPNLPMSDGSRRMESKTYLKGMCFAYPGAPFPQNLRYSRRNRPHRNRIPPQNYTPTQEDLEIRNPILASKKDIVISEGGKSLCPIKEIKHYEKFVRVRE